MPPVKLEQIPRLRALMRSHFLSGLLVVIPTGVIVWILVAALETLWGWHDLIPQQWRPENWLPNHNLALLVSAGLTVAFVLALAAAISIVGWVSKQLLGQKILDFISDHVIKRIPVLRSIHGALDQLLRTMTAGGDNHFSRVVYVEYPRKGMWVLAFVTGPAKGPAVPEGCLNLYVPTTPNPTSGFHVLVHESEVRESEMTVEEAFKTILSLGLAQPDGNGAGGKQQAG